VLGAGFDTAFFQMAAEGVGASKYIELDFLQARRKISAAEAFPTGFSAAWLGSSAAATQPAPVFFQRGIERPLNLRSKQEHIYTPPHLSAAPRPLLQVTQKKAAAIQRVPELRACLGDADDASIQPGGQRLLAPLLAAPGRTWGLCQPCGHAWLAG
jgi:hypothetical protein